MMIKTGQCFFLLFFVVGILLLSGCSEVSVDQEYVDYTNGFALTPPSGWVCSDDGVIYAARFSPNESFRVVLMVSEPMILSEGLALSVFADDVEESFSSDPAFVVEYRDWRDHTEHSAYEIVYVFEEDQTMKGMQVALLQTRTVFLVDFSAPVSEYERLIGAVNESVDSFRII